MPHVKSSSYNEKLATGVAQLLSTHKFSDVQLKVGGKTFHCHRFLLALMSPYFERHLSSSGNQEIVLNDINGDAFDKVLQFIYTGETDVGDQHVENILRAAELIELTELTNFCVEYLNDGVTSDTCSRYWKLAEQMNLATLAAACKRLCLKEFGKVSLSTDLGSLSAKMMRQLLEDDELVVQGEVDVCEALMKWLNSQSQSGNQVQPHQLLTCIRWSGVPVEYVKTKLLTSNILMKDQKSFEFLSKVISYRLTGVQFNGLNIFHRISTGVEQCVVIVGVDDGEQISSDVLLVSLQKNDRVTSTQAIPTSMNLQLSACQYGNQLYLTGAGSSLNETWKWETVVGWTRCADMIEGRRRHCATFVNNTSMNVLGDFVDKGNVTLDSIEQYNTLTNKWTKVGKLTQATYVAACVIYRTSIYVFGGRGQNDVIYDCVQVFDTATKLCTVLPQRLPRSERLLRAAMWDKSVILLNDSTCLIFDLEQQTFQQRDQFATGMIHFGLVLENQRIFVIGGGVGQEDADGKLIWTCSDEVKSVAVMDIINNQTTPNWVHHAKLPTPCLVQAFTAMTLPSD